MYFRWKHLFNNFVISDTIRLFWAIFISMQLSLFIKNMLLLTIPYMPLMLLMISKIATQIFEGLVASALLLTLYFIADYIMMKIGLVSLFNGSFFSISFPDQDGFEL